MTDRLSEYEDAIQAFKARADEIGLSVNVLDDITGMPTGYTGKLFGPARVKSVGLASFFVYAEALALRVTVEPDLELARRMATRWEKRDELRRRPGVVRRRISPQLLQKAASELGRIRGAKAKQFRLSKERRSQINRRNGKKGGRPRRIRPSKDDGAPGGCSISAIHVSSGDRRGGRQSSRLPSSIKCPFHRPLHPGLAAFPPGRAVRPRH